MAIGNVKKLQKKNEHGAVQGTSMVSGSNQVAGKYESEGNSSTGSNLDCKKSFSRVSEEVVDEAGFVAFNADYHAPRHHSPKNN
jgi:hypothetical protein